ncbi:Ocs element-binding factor 1 [Morus notabilis]|uniref:Ocs element-binding factor 1 n=1 Tax=Morus notabilis TaxID=981085 RepID=W9QZ38_9ROSA|nr:bZIP transcription factor 11 [Morus notabilis]EXB44939.1 Ocs element-binding factor 1 [Morus notabilis]
MIPGELTGIYYFPHENPIPLVLPPSFNNNIQSFQNFSSSSSSNNNNAIPTNFQYITTPCPSSNASSTSDEAEEEQQQQLRIIDERRQRRMISNRESARRSRMRKQKHLDELWSQVVRLRSENHSLIDKLNHVSECHDRVLEENARLKEEASNLRQMLTDLKITSPYSIRPNVEQFMDDQNHDDHDHFDHHDQVIIPCNAAHLRAESSSGQSIANSVDLLH